MLVLIQLTTSSHHCPGSMPWSTVTVIGWPPVAAPLLYLPGLLLGKSPCKFGDICTYNTHRLSEHTYCLFNVVLVKFLSHYCQHTRPILTNINLSSTWWTHLLYNPAGQHQAHHHRQWSVQHCHWWLGAGVLVKNIAIEMESSRACHLLRMWWKITGICWSNIEMIHLLDSIWSNLLVYICFWKFKLAFSHLKLLSDGMGTMSQVTWGSRVPLASASSGLCLLNKKV